MRIGVRHVYITHFDFLRSLRTTFLLIHSLKNQTGSYRVKLEQGSDKMKEREIFMKKVMWSFLILSLFILASCNPSTATIETTLGDPDLVVVNEELSISDDGLITAVTFKIRNIGSAASTPSRVYVNAINPDIPEPGDVNQIRLQESFSITALGPDEETEEIVSTFTQEEPNQLGIQYYDIIADPKNEVDETDETNNEFRLFVSSAEQGTVDLLIITTSAIVKTPDFEDTVNQYLSVLAATDGLSAAYIELDSDECFDTYGVKVTGEWDYFTYWPEIRDVLQEIIGITHSSYIMILGGPLVIPRPVDDACCYDQDNDLGVPSDAWYVDFDNDQIVDEGLSIGRLPDVSYDSSAVVSGLQTAIELHTAGGYTLGSEAVFSMYGYTTPPYGACCTESEAFFTLMSTSDYIRFAGHGSPEEIESNSFQLKISISEMDSIDLQSNHPVIVAYSPCYAGTIYNNGSTLAYEFMKRGAAAYLARTTTYGIPAYVGDNFPSAIEGGMRIGPALFQSMRQAVLDQGDTFKDNAGQINLYGDPTLRLR